MTIKSITKVTICALLSAVTMPATISYAAEVFAPPQSQAAAYVPAVNDWSGVYVGGTIGFGSAETDSLFDSSTDDPDNLIDGSLFDLGGVTGSAHIGFNRQLSNNYVLGIEGDWTFLDWSETLTEPDGGTEAATFEFNSIMTLRGRLGAPVSDSTLIFGTGGVALLDASYTACDECDDADDPQSGTVEFDGMGWVAGAGIEHRLSSAFSLRAEGLFYRWDETIDTSNLADDADEDDFAEISNVFQFRIGASYHF